MSISKLLLLLISIVTFIPMCYSDDPKTTSYNCTLFNFGDSNSATRFRSSNGGVYVDYICENLGLPNLVPYNESLTGLDYPEGLNFAENGASTPNLYEPNTSSHTQVTNFGLFQNRTRQLGREGKQSTSIDDYFNNAIYTMDIGQNDLSPAFNGSSYEFIVSKNVPEILKRIENAIKELHRLGAKKFWLYNTGPLGCLPVAKSSFPNYSEELDGTGCRLFFNNVAKAFNKGFDELCDAMRAQLKDTVIVRTDMFSIKYDLFANPGKYGFKYPFDYCCMNCGSPDGFRCPNPSQRILWDFLHYTDAAQKAVALEILSSNHSFPIDMKLRDLCNN